MSTDQILGREQIRSLLTEVGAILHERRIEATVYVLGGAAMALEFDSRRITHDVDVAFRGARDEVERAVAQVAQRHGLARDWLNGNAAAFMSNEPDDDAAELTLPGLRVVVASAKHLIAMKLRSMRDRDRADLVALFRHAGIRTPQEAADIHNAMFDESYVGFYDPDEALFEAQTVFEHARRTGHPLNDPASQTQGTHVGEHWVSPHMRNGNPVEGHWRRSRRTR